MAETDEIAGDEYDAIVEEATRLLRAWSRGIRGQVVMPQDGLDYWTALVARRAEREARIKAEERLRKAGEDLQRALSENYVLVQARIKAEAERDEARRGDYAENDHVPTWSQLTSHWKARADTADRRGWDRALKAAADFIRSCPPHLSLQEYADAILALPYTEDKSNG